MSEEKRITLEFATEGEVEAFKKGLFWDHKEVAADLVTYMLLPDKWVVEVIEVEV